jgi:TP901 family phage tail tape measure protein
MTKKTLLAEIKISKKTTSDLEAFQKKLSALAAELKKTEAAFAKVAPSSRDPKLSKALKLQQNDLGNFLNISRKNLLSGVKDPSARKFIETQLAELKNQILGSVKTSFKEGLRLNFKELEKEAYSKSQYKAPRGSLLNKDLGKLTTKAELSDMREQLKLSKSAATEYVKNLSTSGKAWTNEHKLAQNQLALFEKRLKEVNEMIRALSSTKSSGGVPLPKKTAHELAQLRASQGALDGSAKRNYNGGANLFLNQAQVMRNFLIMGGGLGALGSSASFVTGLDKSFKQLQSIVNLTNNEMETLSKRLIDVSEKTKFTAVEVADAAIVLGQAGLGKDQIENSIEAITLFATAVGSDLKSAVDLATSTLGVYNKDASQMTTIVDEMTVAINNSKLNLEKLTLGLQYSGNIAAQSNVTFEETVAALAAMANSGIRAGSTLGTGLRQILIALQNPSVGFRKRVSELNIDMAKLNISTHGLIPVLKELGQAGFTVNDAMKTMQVRAASAYGAFINNIDSAEELSVKMKLGGAATKANATQMKAFSNQLDRFGSTAKSVVYEAFKPFLETLTKIIEKGADFLSFLKAAAPLLTTIATPLLVLGSVLATRSVASLGYGVVASAVDSFRAARSTPKITKGETASAGKVIKETITKGGSVRSLASAVLSVLKVTPVVAAITTIASAAILGYSYLNNKSTQGLKSDIAQANVNEATSKFSKFESTAKKVNKEVISLISKQQLLINDTSGALLTREIQRLNREYKTFGLYLDSSVTSFDDLLHKVQDFRANLSGIGDDYKKSLYKQGGLLDKAAFIDIEDYLNKKQQKASEQRRAAKYETGVDNIPYGSYGYTPPIELPENNRQKTTKAALIEVLGSKDLYKELITNSYSNVNSLKQNSDSEAGFARSKTYVDNLNKGIAVLEGFFSRNQDSAFNIIGKKVGTSGTQVKSELKATLEDFKHEMELITKFLETRKNVFEANSASAKETQAAIDEALGKNGFQQRASFLQSNLQKSLLPYQKSVNGGANGDVVAIDSIKAIAKIVQDFKSKSDQNTKEFVDYLKTNYPKIKNVSDVVSRVGAGAFEQLPASVSQTLNTLAPYASKAYQNEIDAVGNKITQVRADLDTQELGNSEMTKYQTQLADLYKKQADLQSQKLLIERASSSTGVSVDQFNSEEERIKTELDANLNKLNILVSEGQSRAKIANKLLNHEAFSSNDLIKNYSTTDLLKVVNPANNAEKTRIGNARTKDLENVKLAETMKEAMVQAMGDALSTSQDVQGTSPEDRKKAYAEYLAYQKTVAEQERKIVDLKLSAEADYVKAIKIWVSELESLSSVATPAAKLKIKEITSKLEKSLQESKTTDLATEKEAKTNARNQLQRERQGNLAAQSGYNTSAEYRRAKGTLNGQGYVNSAGDNISSGSSDSAVNNAIGYISGEVNAAYEGYDGMTSMLTELTNMSKGLGDSFGNTFASFATGAESAGTAFRNLATSMLAEMANIAARAAMNQVFSYIFQGIGGLAGGSAAGGSTSGYANMGSFGAPNYTGGLITAGRYAAGGLITSGISTRDSTLAHVAKGEFVLRKRAVDALGLDTVRSLNAADTSTIKSGETKLGANTSLLPKQDDATSNTVNVWVVSPDQKPKTLGARDIIATVSDDIARGGQVKQLIKQVQMGK